MLNGLFPVFARNQAHVSETTIGAFFLLNSLLIIALQMPIAHASEGRRRMRGFALMGVLFALCWLLVFSGGVTSDAVAVAFLAGGITEMSVGECLYDSIQGPLVSDLAPEGLVGRYMAVMGVLLAARFHRRAGSRRCGVGRGAARALADHGRALARRRALLVARRAAAAGGSEAKPEAGETASS
jgi:hypothetical protein